MLVLVALRSTFNTWIQMICLLACLVCTAACLLSFFLLLLELISIAGGESPFGAFSGFGGMGGGGGDDGFSSFFGGGGGSRARSNQPRQSPPMEATLNCSLEELYTGTKKRMKITRQVMLVVVVSQRNENHRCLSVFRLTFFFFFFIIGSQC